MVVFDVVMIFALVVGLIIFTATMSFDVRNQQQQLHNQTAAEEKLDKIRDILNT